MSQHLLSAIKSARRHPGRGVESVRRLPARGRVLGGSAQRSAETQMQTELRVELSTQSDIPQAAGCSLHPSTSPPAQIHTSCCWAIPSNTIKLWPRRKLRARVQRIWHTWTRLLTARPCAAYYIKATRVISAAALTYLHAYIHTYIRGVRGSMSVCPSVRQSGETYIHRLHTYIYIYTTAGVAHVTRRVTPSQRACRSRQQQKKCSGRAAIWRQGSSHGGPSDQQPHAPDARQGRTAPRAGCRAGHNARQGHGPWRARGQSAREGERARHVEGEGEGEAAEAVVVCQIRRRDATEAH
ncbi:hypothetical protein COCMIDRAFT_29783 [Bipolaris oryzae ATCC 44560]|uniref:Uncharacterized protein n=1 Tax=Bipolaris oryzae ATCC 44560 TaxID=930090 RepID=W6YV87_COCMI|nr:uncharacterized protein COCMIDRAFT_29783 [Bipolaris oryzae ATCC 44560]EUC41455.1 hypothetical protein COCMIDRAFT_29783 [Bipolaris oryzae ATCC 44560]